MNLSQFKEGFQFVLKWEGGYVDDPDDPGGQTKYGISKAAYPHLNIPELKMIDAVYIYYEDYWAKAGCSELDYPLNIVVFDTAVNCGVGRATHWLKKAKNVHDYLDIRKQHYLNLAESPRFRKYLRGWLNRLNDLKKLVEIAEEKGAA
jgi:lysozyme family protein